MVSLRPRGSISLPGAQAQTGEPALSRVSTTDSLSRTSSGIMIDSFASSSPFTFSRASSGIHCAINESPSGSGDYANSVPKGLKVSIQAPELPTACSPSSPRRLSMPAPTSGGASVAPHRRVSFAAADGTNFTVHSARQRSEPRPLFPQNSRDASPHASGLSRAHKPLHTKAGGSPAASKGQLSPPGAAVRSTSRSQTSLQASSIRAHR